jgi:hypothetical protein
MGSMPAEIADRRGGHLQSLGAKKRSLQRDISAKTAEFARRRNDSMTRNIRPSTFAHDVADRARRAWPSRCFSDITVGGHTAHWDSPNDREDGPGERGQSN